MAEYLLYSDGDNKALRDAIFKATPKAVEQMKSMAQRFKGATDMDTCRNIWNFLKYNIRYVADGDHQKVKLPSALLREKVGDCKSFSLFTAAILENLNINWHYVLSSYSNDPTPQHIYVVCDNGTIIDAVWTDFNKEKKPTYRYKHKVNKNDMRISYIAGIPAQRKSIGNCGSSCGCAPCKRKYGTNGIRGTQTMIANSGRSFGTESQFMGIGRTGIDWLKAATGREATFGESAEYYTKNISLAPMRYLMKKFIANNGGGIATFLYNAWLREEVYYLPNEAKYQAEYSTAYKQLKSLPKYNLLDTPAFKFTTEELDKMNSRYSPSSSGAVFSAASTSTSGGGMTIQQALTPARYQEYLNFKKAYDSQVASFNSEIANLKSTLNKKYPENTRFIKPATEQSKKKYRDIELMWFWKLGGSPDDFNDAVKEGNTKSPRGRDANYMLNKAFNGNLGAKDLGLVLRSFLSAFGGDKFGVGQDGTFLIALNGFKKGIGLEPVTTTAAATGAAVETTSVITAYIVPITESLVSILGLLGSMGVFSQNANTTSDASLDPNPALYPDPKQGGDEEKEGSSDTTTMLIIGAAVVGGFLLLNK